MRTIQHRRDDGCSHESHDDEHRAADSGFVFGVSVRIEDLVEERAECVEEACVCAEGEKDDVEGARGKDVFDRGEDWDFGEPG